MYFLKKIADFGIKDNFLPLEKRNLQIINLISVTNLFLSIMMIVLSLFLHLPLLSLAISAIILLIAIIPFALNYFGKVLLSRISFLIINYILVLLLATSYGREVNVHNYTIVFASIPLLFFENEVGKLKWFFILISIPIWLFTEYIFTNFKPIVALDSDILSIMGLANILAVFILVFSIGTAFTNQNKILLNSLNEKKDKLKAKNEQLKQFAYIVSHDLKGPLRNISIQVDLLNESMSDMISSDTKESFENIKINTKKSNDLINSILEYSVADKPDLEISSFPSNKIFNDINSIIYLPENFKISYPTEVVFFKGVYIQLYQILINLIENAIKYNDKKQGFIEISISSHNKDFFLIDVKDNGPGIEKEYRKKIFQVFETTNINKSSSGIGLAIVEKLVKKNGGEIKLNSVLNEGASFCFTWPKDLDQNK